MSIKHKAFVFDYRAFERELMPLLVQSLEMNDASRLFEFVEANQTDLVDPYEGEPLNDDWRSMLEVEDPHQVGDFALTKYYDPVTDIGIGSEWMSLVDTVRDLVLGKPIGPRSNPFDPGKMGSYFQSPEDVAAAYEAVKRTSGVSHDAVLFYERALRDPKGLYVTF